MYVCCHCCEGVSWTGIEVYLATNSFIRVRIRCNSTIFTNLLAWWESSQPTINRDFSIKIEVRGIVSFYLWTTFWLKNSLDHWHTAIKHTSTVVTQSLVGNDFSGLVLIGETKKPPQHKYLYLTKWLLGNKVSTRLNHGTKQLYSGFTHHCKLPCTQLSLTLYITNTMFSTGSCTAYIDNLHVVITICPYSAL